MFALGNLCVALAYILDIVLTGYLVIMLARAVLSWFDYGAGYKAYRPRVSGSSGAFYLQLRHALILATEPLLRPIRRRVQLRGVPVDFAFLILALVLLFLRVFLVGTLMDIGTRLRIVP